MKDITMTSSAVRLLLLPVMMMMMTGDECSASER